MNDLSEQQYQAVKDKDYIKANEISDEMSKIEQELSDLSKEAEIDFTQSDEVPLEEKIDPPTLRKCLKIMCCMLQADSVTKLNLSTMTLMQNLALANANVRSTKTRFIFKNLSIP